MRRTLILGLDLHMHNTRAFASPLDVLASLLAVVLST